MVSKADIAYQVNAKLEAEDIAYAERVEKQKNAQDQIFIDPHPYPEPREVTSARLAEDELAGRYIRAIILCGKDGILGHRKLIIPESEFVEKPKATEPKATRAKPKTSGRTTKASK